MRLIDADALLDRLPKVDLDHDEKITRSGAIMDVICLVDTAPTVELPRWIPVSDPPKETGHYWVSLHQENPEGDSNDIVLDAWFQKDVFLFTSSEAGWHLLNEFYDLTPQLREYITHWMPLPEPPEVE